MHQMQIGQKGTFCCSLTFPSALEKEPDHQDLQGSHTDHHQHLDQTEIENPLFRTPDSTKVAVLPGPEILLHPADRAQLAADFVHHVFEL